MRRMHRAGAARGATLAVLLAGVAAAASAPAAGQTVADAAAGGARVPSDEEQAAAAVLAAPAESRAGARVLGWAADGTVRELRPGSSELICLADDPRDAQFSVACYHASLEPYMARGRELAAQGVTGMERNTRRWEEAEAGTLPMPQRPAMLYVLHGSGFDMDAGAVTHPFLRWSIYTPGATAETTGVGTTPAPGVPWLMFPGTPGAHIMIVPARPGG